MSGDDGTKATRTTLSRLVIEDVDLLHRLTDIRRSLTVPSNLDPNLTSPDSMALKGWSHPLGDWAKHVVYRLRYHMTIPRILRTTSVSAQK